MTGGPDLPDWPAMPQPDAAPEPLRDRLRAAGGARRVLPGYLAAQPRRNGLLLSDYLALGLQDRPRAEARAHLGALGAARLALGINSQSNRRGLVADKMLLDAVLRGSGLPVPELKGVYGRPAPIGAAHINSADDLRELLSSPRALPLFGKPAMAQASQDVLAAVAFDAAADEIHMPDGRAVPVDRILAHLRRRHRGSGYLFQSFIRQHTEVSARVGNAVATVRLITLFQDHGIHFVAAGWKVPRLGALADTPQRGNLIAPLDPATGTVGAALPGFRADAPRQATHPDTGALLEGLTLPHWERVVNQTRRAAGLLHVLPLIGWDVAIGEHGPVFVEANTNPSLEAYQFLTGRGALAGETGERLKRALAASRAAERKRRRARRARRRGMIWKALGLGR